MGTMCTIQGAYTYGPVWVYQEDGYHVYYTRCIYLWAGLGALVYGQRTFLGEGERL